MILVNHQEVIHQGETLKIANDQGMGRELPKALRSTMLFSGECGSPWRDDNENENVGAGLCACPGRPQGIAPTIFRREAERQKGRQDESPLLTFTGGNNRVGAG